MIEERPRLQAVGWIRSPEGSIDVPADVLRLVSLPEERRSLLLQVTDLIDEIAFGTVVIVMHEGKITQIETSEKIRLR
jgi:hypothetical protein